MLGNINVVEISVKLMSSLQIEKQPSARVKRTDKYCVQKVRKEKYGENKRWKRFRAIKKQRNSVPDVEIDPKWTNFNEVGAPLGDGWLPEPIAPIRAKLVRSEPEQHWREQNTDFSLMYEFWLLTPI